MVRNCFLCIAVCFCILEALHNFAWAETEYKSHAFAWMCYIRIMLQC